MTEYLDAAKRKAPPSPLEVSEVMMVIMMVELVMVMGMVITMLKVIIAVTVWR